jgi:hypothetical protein
MTLQQTLEYFLKAITNESKDITVDTIEDNGMTTLTINAPKEKIGQIIGKEGKIIKSLRTLLGISFPQSRFNIEIKE